MAGVVCILHYYMSGKASRCRRRTICSLHACDKFERRNMMVATLVVHLDGEVHQRSLIEQLAPRQGDHVGDERLRQAGRRAVSTRGRGLHEWVDQGAVEAGSQHRLESRLLRRLLDLQEPHLQTNAWHCSFVIESQSWHVGHALPPQHCTRECPGPG